MTISIDRTPRYPILIMIVLFSFLQRNSVSPAEREKYRPRSPVEIEEAKRRKEDKLTNVSR